MPKTNDPNLGLSYGWDFGEEPWNEGMDENLVVLGATSILSVKSVTVAAQPAGINGDVYFVPAGSTGAEWSANPESIAIYEGDKYNRWFFVPVKTGWYFTVQDDPNPNKIQVWNGSSFEDSTPTGDFLTAASSYTGTGDVEFTGRTTFTGTHTGDTNELATIADVQAEIAAQDFSNFVDLASAQTITGVKTFNEPVAGAQAVMGNEFTTLDQVVFGLLLIGGDNLGGFNEVYSFTDQGRLKFRTIQSSDGSVSIAQNADDLDLTVAAAVNTDTFLELLDTPNSFAGNGGRLAQVNLAEDSLVFVVPFDETFNGLTDAPNDYVGFGGYSVRVNQAEDALEFVEVQTAVEVEQWTPNVFNAPLVPSVDAANAEITFVNNETVGSILNVDDEQYGNTFAVSSTKNLSLDATERCFYSRLDINTSGEDFLTIFGFAFGDIAGVLIDAAVGVSFFYDSTGDPLNVLVSVGDLQGTGGGTSQLIPLADFQEFCVSCSTDGTDWTVKFRMGGTASIPQYEITHVVNEVASDTPLSSINRLLAVLFSTDAALNNDVAYPEVPALQYNTPIIITDGFRFDTFSYPTDRAGKAYIVTGLIDGENYRTEIGNVYNGAVVTFNDSEELTTKTIFDECAVNVGAGYSWEGQHIFENSVSLRGEIFDRGFLNFNNNGEILQRNRRYSYTCESNVGTYNLFLPDVDAVSQRVPFYVDMQITGKKGEEVVIKSLSANFWLNNFNTLSTDFKLYAGDTVRFIYSPAAQFAGNAWQVVFLSGRGDGMLRMPFSSDTAYSVTAENIGDVLLFGTATDVTLFVPDTIGRYARFEVIQGAAGQIVWSPTGSANIINVDGHTRSKGQGAKLTFITRDGVTWYVTGDTAA